MAVTSKQGRIHDIRCVPFLHYAVFSDFYKRERQTDGPTDRRTPSYRDARMHLINGLGPVMVRNTLYPAVHILGI